MWDSQLLQQPFSIGRFWRLSGSSNHNELITFIVATVGLSLQKMGPLIILPSGVLELYQIMLY